MNIPGLPNVTSSSSPKAGSSLEERYQNLMADRTNYLESAREYSRMTLPWLLPDSTPRPTEGNQHGWQSLGAQLVRHLANKITQTLFPTEQPFFAFHFTKSAEAELTEAGYDLDQLNQILVSLRDRAMEVHSSELRRIELINAMLHLLVAGNGLLYRQSNNDNYKFVPMDRYVQRMDMSGTLVELVMVQVRHLYTFDQDTQARIKASRSYSGLKDKTQIPLYTGTKLLPDGKYEIKQEALDVPIGQRYTVTEEKLPFLSLVWMRGFGEHWGRGLVEEHAGDLYVYDFLSEAMAKGMALMADVKYMVKPGSSIDVDHAISSPTGEWITGNMDDVSVLQLERYADFSPISQVADEYKRRLGQAFLMASAVRRDAERVTTYELRMDANELETSLGGVYSHLSDSIQRPLARRYRDEALEGSDNSEALQDSTMPVILTGTQALGKASELDKIVQFSEMMKIPNEWPEKMQRAVDFPKYSNKVASLLYLETDWIKSSDQVRQEEAAEQQQQLLNQAGGEATKAIPEMMKGQINNGN